MNPATLNLVINQGSTFFKRFTWKDHKSPVNILDFTFRMQIRDEVDSEVIILDLSSEQGHFSVIDPVSGIFELRVSPEETKALSFKRAVYDIEALLPDGNIFRIIQGRISLSKEVTR